MRVASRFKTVGPATGITGHLRVCAATEPCATLKIAAMNGVRAMIETLPLERAAEGYERMISGRVRFRSVLKI